MNSTSLIRNALANSPDSDQHEQVWHLNLQLQTVVSNIRELPGLSRFLLPPLFSDLQQAARGGPVIILNASEYSCDALVILMDRDPVHIPPSITKDDIRGLSRKLQDTLARRSPWNVTRDLFIIMRELWVSVVSPIVDFLQTVHPLQSRIWWCLAAEFFLLPLHAAGPYRRGLFRKRQKDLSDLYVSSYTPTLTALIRVISPSSPNSVTEKKHFIGIGQATASGTNKLPFVSIEF